MAPSKDNRYFLDSNKESNTLTAVYVSAIFVTFLLGMLAGLLLGLRFPIPSGETGTEPAAGA